MVLGVSASFRRSLCSALLCCSISTASFYGVQKLTVSGEYLSNGNSNDTFSAIALAANRAGHWSRVAPLAHDAERTSIIDGSDASIVGRVKVEVDKVHESGPSLHGGNQSCVFCANELGPLGHVEFYSVRERMICLDNRDVDAVATSSFHLWGIRGG